MSSRVVLACLVALLCLTAAPLWASSVVYSFPMDSDPGWARDSEWDFGSGPNCGALPDDCGSPGAHTGSNVFAISLGTAFPSDMGTQNLTTGALDCSALTSVSLRFWRWIGMTNDTTAAVQVSNDGSTWTDVWSEAASYTDSSWTQCSYDISAVAAGQSTVYVRWTMTNIWTDPDTGGCGDTCWGWTIDDVEILSNATEILAWIPYADVTEEWPNTLDALNSRYSDFNATETTTTDAATLESQLVGKHVFLVPEQENATTSDLETAGGAFSEVLWNFVQGGGTVVVLGEWDAWSGFVSATGLLRSDYVTGYFGGETLSVAAPSHPLADGLGSTVAAANATAAYQAGPEATVVIDDGAGNAIVAARQMGAGAVVVMGYDFYEWDDSAAIVLANAVQYPRASKSVLLYESDPVLHAGLEALSRLKYLPEIAGDSDFNTALGSDSWNAVVVDAPSGTPGDWQPFADWVAAGGHAAVSTWNLDVQTVLSTAMGVSAGSSLTAVPAVYDWNTDIPLFTFNRSVPSDLLDWIDLHWDLDANQLTLTAPDALALAGFTATPTVGEAAIVAGNNYSTLINGFLWDDRNQDSDGDGVQDVVELVMNEVQLILTVPFPHFSASMTECVTGDSVVFTDATVANVTGWLWDFGDSTTTAIRNPSHAYADPGKYTVILVASNRNGFDTEVKDKYIWVGFPDTPPATFWAFDQVLDCIDAGVVAGYEDDLYHPEIAIDRAQMATYTARALAGGDANVPDGPGTATFPDVGTGFWAFKYIEYAVTNHVVQGYEDLNYHPEIVLDRGQMAVFVARAVAGDEASVPAGPADPTFPDVGTGFWAYKHIEYCADQGIVSGYADGTYQPGVQVTRDQMAVYVARALPLL